MTALTVMLPWPGRYLWPNKHTRSHIAKAAQVKQARWDAWYAAADARNQAGWETPLKARLTIVVKTNKPGPLPDPDNCQAACKPYIDGCTDADIWVDDNSDHLEIQPVRVERWPYPCEIQFYVEAVLLQESKGLLEKLTVKCPCECHLKVVFHKDSGCPVCAGTGYILDPRYDGLRLKKEVERGRE